jgi:hypothetical protein
MRLESYEKLERDGEIWRRGWREMGRYGGEVREGRGLRV